jgi:hypothetical protein
MLTTVVLLLGLLVVPTTSLSTSHATLARPSAGPMAKVVSGFGVAVSHVASRPASTISAGGRVYQSSWLPPTGSAQMGDIAVDSASRTVYAIETSGPLLAAFNGFTGATERTLVLANDTSNYYPVSIALDNLSGRLYVGLHSSSASDVIAVIEAGTFAWVTNISYGSAGLPTFQPYRLFFEWRANQLLAENALNQSVVVVNTTSNTIATWLGVGCSGTGFCNSYYGMFDMVSLVGPLVILPAETSFAWAIAFSPNPVADTVVFGFNSSHPNFDFAAGTFSSVTNLTYFTNYSSSGDVAAYDRSGNPVGSVSVNGAPGFPEAVAWDALAGQLAVAVYNSSVGAGGAQIDILDASTGVPTGELWNASLPAYKVISDLASFDATNGTAYLVTSGQYAGVGELVQVGHPTPSLSLVRTYSTNGGQYLFPTSVDPSLGLAIELGTAGEVIALSDSTGAVQWTTQIAGAPSSQWVTTDLGDGIVYVATSTSIVAISASTGSVQATFPISYYASYISFGFNHLLYATDGSNDTIQVYSNAGGATSLAWFKTITLAASSSACSLSASPVAEVVADLSCGFGDVTQISSAATGTTIANVTGSSNGYASVFNATGALFVGNDTFANRTGAVVVFAPSTWTLVRTLWTSVPVDFLDFVPQLNAVAVGGYGTPIVLASATTGATLATFHTPGRDSWLATDWSTGAITADAISGETLLATLVALPGAASGLTLHAGNGTLTATWTAASSAPGFPITGYTVYTAPAATGPWTSAATPPTNSTTLSGLTDGTTYYVTVRATSGSGTGALSAAVSGVPAGVPYPPTGVTITSSTTSSLSVSWGAPSSTGGAAVTAYTVLYATSASGPWSTASAGTQTTATVTSLTSGTNYFVKVEAANSAGTGNPSASVQGKTGGSAPGSSLGGLSGSSWLWIVLIVVALIVVAVVVMAVMRRGKSGPSTAGAPPPGSTGPTAPPPGASGGEPPMAPPGAQ